MVTCSDYWHEAEKARNLTALWSSIIWASFNFAGRRKHTCKPILEFLDFHNRYEATDLLYQRVYALTRTTCIISDQIHILVIWLMLSHPKGVHYLKILLCLTTLKMSVSKLPFFQFVKYLHEDRTIRFKESGFKRCFTDLHLQKC